MSHVICLINIYAAPAERPELAWVLEIQESEPLLDPEGLGVWAGETDV